MATALDGHSYPQRNSSFIKTQDFIQKSGFYQIQLSTLLTNDYREGQHYRQATIEKINTIDKRLLGFIYNIIFKFSGFFNSQKTLKWQKSNVLSNIARPLDKQIQLLSTTFIRNIQSHKGKKCQKKNIQKYFTICENVDTWSISKNYIASIVEHNI